jgi:hypothetical protein
MLFISTGIFDDKLRPQILSVGTTANSGADPGFQVRGGALKKNCAERREARKFLGYFV